MFKILKLCNDNYLNIETKLHVFDTIVASVLNYGAEVWGFHPGNGIEKGHTRFCKMILKVKNSTPNLMVYMELGRLPLHIIRKLRILKYWVKLLTTDNCILRGIYDEMLEHPQHNSWASMVKNMLCSLGFNDIWLLQYVSNPNILYLEVKQRLMDNFIQERNTFFENSSKCLLYKHMTD